MARKTKGSGFRSVPVYPSHIISRLKGLETALRKAREWFKQVPEKDWARCQKSESGMIVSRLICGIGVDFESLENELQTYGFVAQPDADSEFFSPRKPSDAKQVPSRRRPKPKRKVLGAS